MIKIIKVYGVYILTLELFLLSCYCLLLQVIFLNIFFSTYDEEATSDLQSGILYFYNVGNILSYPFTIRSNEESVVLDFGKKLIRLVLMTSIRSKSRMGNETLRQKDAYFILPYGFSQ